MLPIKAEPLGVIPRFPRIFSSFMHVQALSDLRAKVGGGKDQGITIPAAAASIYGPNILEFFQANIVPADTDAMIFARTPQEVLAIAYGGNANQPGGFFPAGLNGIIK